MGSVLTPFTAAQSYLLHSSHEAERGECWFSAGFPQHTTVNWLRTSWKCCVFRDGDRGSQVYTNMWKPEDSCHPLVISLFFFLRQSLTLTWCMSIKLGQWALGSTRICFCSARITSVCPHSGFFISTRFPELRLRFSSLQGKCFIKLSP